MDELEALLANLPGYALLTPSMKQAALDGARIPDSFLIWPGEDGYETTYDPYFAALNLLGFLMAQPVVRQSSSEGTAVAVDAPSWSALAAYFRSQSYICSANGNQVLQEVPIPGGPHVYKTDMSGRWDGNGDVDTDLG
uniref:Tail terminator n=1 Tax=Micrococcus phage Olihed TaxID=3092209 RepID=A0AAU6R5X5_9CAUD